MRRRSARSPNGPATSSMRPSGHEGRYYLPYQLHATPDQFERAYPEVAQLRQLKGRVDPQGRFSNSLWQKYL